jgi:hypothetical protein
VFINWRRLEMETCRVLEEVKNELLEMRGGEATNMHFFEHDISSKPKPAEVRKCDRCNDWLMRKLPLHIIIE